MNKNNMIIGIIGKKRSGKDTTADYLVQEYNFHKFSFAEPMRRFAKDVFGWDNDWIENHKEEIDPEWGISYRQFMQHIGTDYMQYDLGEVFPQYKETTGREVWIKSFLKHREKDMKPYVLSDVRFPHEADLIKANGGILIRIDRPEYSNVIDNHASEKEQEDIVADYHIVNRGKSLGELYLEVVCVMEEILNEK